MKLNKKIDLYIKTDSNRWIYYSSTNWSHTCKEAKERFIQKWNNPAILEVKARFSKSY